MLKQTSSEYRGFRTAGIRLREEMMPHLARLTAGRARLMFHALHAFDKAQAVMLTEQGLLPRETAAAILRALREIEKAADSAGPCREGRFGTPWTPFALDAKRPGQEQNNGRDHSRQG